MSQAYNTAEAWLTIPSSEELAVGGETEKPGQGEYEPAGLVECRREGPVDEHPYCSVGWDGLVSDPSMMMRSSGVEIPIQT